MRGSETLVEPVIAIDCGGTKLAGARSSGSSAIGTGLTVERPARLDEVPAATVELIRRLGGPARSVGIGVAGLVDHRAGVLVWMPHVAGAMVPIAEEVRAATGMTVAVDNDANLAALAEARLGAGAGERTVLMVVMGTGIGGGLVIEGRVERGHGYLGEIGHMTAHPGGAPCPCGRRGCWETVASGRALDAAAERLAREHPDGPLGGTSPVGGRRLVATAHAGDAGSVAAIEAVGAELGRGLVDLALVLDPDVIVIGGGPVAAGDLLLAPARRIVERELPGRPHRRLPRIVAGTWAERAGLVGAAIMARQVAP